ncbi:hypothetical protein K502DRAFT_326653 [Neoconidiobolus thromboides FSU 785]|nr:hypothetical protein K502DRAFT_326653 [Neoconidiobolus thromboides FSU 785]
MSLNLELNNNKIVNKNTQLNVYNYFQLLVNTSLILLYYPILQLIPKPVKFSKEENELLLNLVDMSFEIIFKSDNKDSTINEVDNPLTEIKVLIAGIEKKQTIISCAQFAIFIYVYWNIIYILKDEEVGVGYNEITNNCKERSLTILNVIKQVSIKSKKEVRNDARLSLIELNRALNRFQLPLDYVEKVNNVMNN